MEDDLQKRKEHFWGLVLSVISILIMGLFFAFGFYFKIWGEKFSDVPRYVNYIYYGFGLLFVSIVVSFGIYLTKFKINYQQKTENTSRTSWIIISILSTAYIILQVFAIPWRADFAPLSLGEAPLWAPPRVNVMLEGKELIIRPIVDVKRLLMNFVLVGIVVAMLIITTIRTKKKEKKLL